MKKRIFAVYILIMVLLVSLSLPVKANTLGVGDTVLINGELEATIIDFENGYPVYQAVIYPNIDSSSSDGYLINQGEAVYANARTAANADAAQAASSLVYVSNNYSISFGTYSVMRGFLYFDTSVFDGYTITAGSVNVYVQNIIDNNNESVQIQSGMATYPHDPLVVGDFDLSNYAGDGGSKDITTFNIGAYNSITLNATGYGWINKTGWTKYCLRTTGDINNVTPTNGNYLIFYSTNNGSNEPYLSVTFTALTPAVDSLPASNVGTETARLNGDITEDGGDPDCEIRFGYGTTTQTAVNFLLYDTVTAWVDGYDEDDPVYLDIDSLNLDDDYFYRVQVKNETATVTSASEQTFHTDADVLDMTQFVGYPDGTSISLNWVKAVGAENTMIRYRTDDFPTDETDGTQVYFDDGTSYEHTGLDEGTTYYYAAFGENAADYSNNGIELAMTTESAVAGESIAAIAAPASWFQEPDESFLANLQPFYSVINGVADSWGMPRGNMWVGICLLITFIIGAGLYIRFGSPAMAMFVMALVIGGFVLLGILAKFWIALLIILMAGAWATRPQGV